MAYTYDEVMSLLGDEAQAVPGCIMVFRDKHIVVAEVSAERGFRVTEAGSVLLVEIAGGTPKAATKPARKSVKSADKLATLSDLDLET